MIEWSESQQLIRDTVRKFVEAEIKPHLEELEYGDTPPYDVLRKMIRTFGMDELARARFRHQIERDKAAALAKGPGEPPPRQERSPRADGGDSAAMQIIPIIELCRFCPGMVTAMGVSMGLTAASIMSKGTLAQKERWVLPLLTMEKVGAWAITEPGSGSDAFGAMRALARRVKAGGLDPESIDETQITGALYTAGVPDPDLLIRTAGEMRVSNFLLWQISYAELYVTPVLWPDFGRNDLNAAIKDFARRDRRFGGL